MRSRGSPAKVTSEAVDMKATGESLRTQQTIYSLLAKLDDPDADLRYMSLNDLYGILTNLSAG
jgi:hypothetical protein